MSNEQINQIINRLGELGEYGQALIPGFLSADNKVQYIRDLEPTLEMISKYTDNYSNVEDFIGDRNTRLSKFYKELDGKQPSKARMQSFLDKNSDISAKDVNEWFDKTNYWKEYEEDLTKKEADRTRRKLEVEGKYTNINDPKDSDKRNWGWLRNMLASDYEKQRYINNPEEALIGEDAPALGEAKETRTGAIADLGTGVAGQVADVGTLFLPFPYNIIANTVTGPLIRTGRDVAHNVTDSPYQDEDWYSDRWKDAAFNATTVGFANASKLARLANTTTAPGKISRLYEINQLEPQLKNTLNEAQKSKLLVSNTNGWVNMVKDLPESPLKSELMSTIDPFKGVNVSEARDIMKAYIRDLDPHTYEIWKQANAKGGLGAIYKAKPSSTVGKLVQAFYTYPEPRSFLKDKLMATPFNELSKGEKIGYGILKGVDMVNKGNTGSVGLESFRNYNNKDKVELVETPESREQFIAEKETMKKLHGQDWLNFGRAFAPKKKPGDPAYEAYVEVTGDTLD